MSKLSKEDQTAAASAINDIASDAQSIIAAAASGFQTGAVQALQTVLRDCRDSLCPDAVSEIADILASYDEAEPYGVPEPVADIHTMSHAEMCEMSALAERAR